MNITFSDGRDERTLAVENASFSFAYSFICYGLLLLVIYRSCFKHESSWDLLGLVILSGFVHLAYQASKRVLSRQWVRAAVLNISIACILAALIAIFRR